MSATAPTPAVDLLSDPSIVERARAEFQGRLAAGDVAGREAWLESGKLYEPAPRPA